MRTAHKVLVRNSEEGRCLRGMEGDTVGNRMDRTETGCDNVEWIRLAQDGSNAGSYEHCHSVASEVTPDLVGHLMCLSLIQAL